ncbi:MAG: LysR family transcriptional regulator [Myxococcota bacterium]
MENWDDLRLFLATARAGSSRGGAEELGVNQSTISRRISGLEKRLAVRLFDRNPSGLELTAAGQELLILATEVEEGIDALDRRLQGRDLELRGPVRLSLPDVFVAPTAGHLARFAAQYPQIELEVMVDNSVVSLTQREADLALRMAGSPPQQLVGRRISPVKMAIYGAVEYLRGREEPIDPATLDWVRWDEEWRGAPPEAWIDANVPPEKTRGRINTSLGHAELVAQGVGVGIKLCYSGDADPRLRRVGEPFDFGFGLWLLTHEDLRSTARVRALMRFLGDALAAERPRFEGVSRS